MRGTIAWLTGLSGAGKSTVAAAARDELASYGLAVDLLDADVVRPHLAPELGYTARDRNLNVARVAWVATRIARHGVIVFVAMISPYAEARRLAREQAQVDGVRFLEVYVAAPLEVVTARDVKGLYRRAIAGEIPNFTGVSDPYEAPAAPDLTLCTDVLTIPDSVSRLVLAVLAT